MGSPEYTTRSPTARGPRDGRRRALRPRRRALRGVRTTVPMGSRCLRGSLGGPWRDGCPQRTSPRRGCPYSRAVGASADGRGARDTPRLAGGPSAEVRGDLVDHRGLGDERDDPHGPETHRTRERVDLKDLLQERRPAGGDLARREARREDHRRRHVDCRVLRLPRRPRGDWHPSWPQMGDFAWPPGASE